MTVAVTPDLAPSVAAQTLRQLRDHLPPGLALAAKLAGSGAVERSADGCRVELSDGRRVLDFGSYAVTLLGHRHPAVVAAVEAQLRVMPTATRSLANPVVASAAAGIAERFGGRLRRVHFGLNGADAVEVAVKLARLRTGRDRIVAVGGGYHGKSLGALALTYQPRLRAGLHGVLGPVTHIAADDPDAVARVAAEGDVAAVVFEPVQGESGVRPLSVEVLRQWCDDAHAAGAFVVADEIQCGLGRCGVLSVALSAGLPVDALLLGKPLGGGVVPLSAALIADDLYRPLAKDPFLHTATFGGHPLCVAAALPALAAIAELLGPAGEISDRFAAGLRELRSERPDHVTDVRGRGHLWALDFSSPALAGEVMVNLAQQGLLVSPCLGQPTALRLLPPLVAIAADVDEALTILRAAVATTVADRQP